MYPDRFGKQEVQAALDKYGDDILAKFRGIRREINKSPDTPNKTNPVAVWKSLLDPHLSHRFPAPLSQRYRDYIMELKQKAEQGTPKRNSPGQIREQQSEQKPKQPGKRKQDEVKSQEDCSPVPPHPTRRQLSAPPQSGSAVQQPEQQQKNSGGKQQNEEAELQEEDETPVRQPPKRRWLTASPQTAIPMQQHKQQQQPQQPQQRQSGKRQHEEAKSSPIQQHDPKRR